MRNDESHKAIDEVLANGDFGNLLGATESLVLEVKGSAPYDFTVPAGQYELAKDVSAFANSNGGHLLIGLETEQHPNERVDRVTALQLIARSEFPDTKIRGLLREYIYPDIAGVQIDWRPSVGDETVGLGVIYVPRQSEQLRPFLITKVVENNQRQKQIIVGIAQRAEADNVPATAMAIHEMIRKGNDTILQRTIRIEDKLDVLTRQHSRSPATTIPAADVLAKHIREMKAK